MQASAVRRKGRNRRWNGKQQSRDKDFQFPADKENDDKENFPPLQAKGPSSATDLQKGTGAYLRRLIPDSKDDNVVVSTALGAMRSCLPHPFLQHPKPSFVRRSPQLSLLLTSSRLLFPDKTRTEGKLKSQEEV